jgi:DNA-binding response OmpR family regulator
MSKLILIVDDEAKLRKVIRAYLEKEGYQVMEAADGSEALFSARKERPDLVLLDVMMPQMNGYEFMRIYRKEAETPIIMLTAKDEENDEVLGLEVGADDYVTKPFSMRSLMARVRAIIRRAEGGDKQDPVLRAGDIVIDPAAREARIRGAVVALTPTEFEFLLAMMRAPGRAFSRFDLLESASGEAYAGYERTVDVHIRNLRRKLEKDASKPIYIETVFGMGYRFRSPED